MNIKKRPVFLDLTKIQLPIMGFVSILHRISGILLFVLMPFIMYYLHLSLKNADTYAALQQMQAGWHAKLIMWLFFSSLGYHMIAGIRHLIMDAGYGESLCAARFSSRVALILSVLLAFGLGIWLW